MSLPADPLKVTPILPTVVVRLVGFTPFQAERKHMARKRKTTSEQSTDEAQSTDTVVYRNLSTGDVVECEAGSNLDVRLASLDHRWQQVVDDGDDE